MSEQKGQAKMDGAYQRTPQDRWIVVGLDFGTTFSGVNWKDCYPDRKHINEDTPVPVRGWPRRLGGRHGGERDQDKAPTRLLFDNEGNVKGWGYEVAGGDGIALELFKLAIVPDNDLPPYLRDSTKLNQTKKQIQDLGLNPTQVIEQYIQKLWTHAQGKIRNGIGQRAFESIRIHVVITIPAIWKNTEVRQMTTAAATSVLELGRGGLTTYEFLSEPEAAVQDYDKTLARKLNKNEIVLVADMGGGTTDIIPYEFLGEERDQIILKEAAPGSGGLYGATNVDEAFENLLLSKLPEQYENLKTDQPDDWRTILFYAWENDIKRSFEWDSEDPRRMWPVRLSYVPPFNEIMVHQDEIRDIFEGSVMPGIISLIKEQIERVKQAYNGQGPRIILPVGGFGRCPYILQRLKQEFEKSKPPMPSRTGRRNQKQPEVERIEVHSEDGEMAWLAVARGACKFGIRALMNKRLVKGRYARISLGFTQCVSGTAEEGAIWMPDFDGYMIPNVMVWILRKGDLIPSNGEKSTLAMELPCELDGVGPRSERSTFYSYIGDEPPDCFDPNDADFQEYGVMEITATKLIEELPITDSPSGGRQVFSYDLKIRIVGSSVQITATSADPDDHGQEVGDLILPDVDMV